MSSEDYVVDRDSWRMVMIAERILMANDRGRVEDGVIDKVSKETFEILERYLRCAIYEKTYRWC